MKTNDFSAALTALRKGEPIIYPTDTLYALGADIYNKTAVKKVFDIKQRPYSIPLPVAVHSLEAIETLAFMNETAKMIGEKFLPGNLTIILKKKPRVPDVVTSGGNTIAVRIPKDPVALGLLALFGPLTVTSANIHQKTTHATVKDILQQLEIPIQVCLDDGRREGTPSTMVNLSTKKPKILREGSITQKELLDVISHG
jgi:L-threonylcarbamoyladenylate synthase